MNYGYKYQAKYEYGFYTSLTSLYNLYSYQFDGLLPFHHTDTNYLTIFNFLTFVIDFKSYYLQIKDLTPEANK